MIFEMNEQQLWKEAYEMYPELAREKKCATLRTLRGQLRKKYVDDRKREIQLLAGDRAEDEILRAGVPAGGSEDIAPGV